VGERPVERATIVAVLRAARRGARDAKVEACGGSSVGEARVVAAGRAHQGLALKWQV